MDEQKAQSLDPGDHTIQDDKLDHGNEIENGGSAERKACTEQKNTGFHVNRDLIPSAQLSENAASEELKALGLDVFNQDDFEQGVMAQVDEALAKEEEERKKKQLEKEEMDNKYEIAKAKKELETLNKVITSLGSAASTSAHVKNRLTTVQKQKENKLSQLKTLLARQKSIQIKLHGASTVDEEIEEHTQEPKDLNHLLGLGGSKETEQERMIRLGQMTPFGTVIVPDPETREETENAAPSTSQATCIVKRRSSHREELITYSTKENKTSHKPKKSKSDSAIMKSAEKERKQENFFDEKDKKHYRDGVEGDYHGSTYRTKKQYKIGHNFTEDSPRSDEEACYQDDPDGYLSDEYRPTEKELGELSSDSYVSEQDETVTERKEKKKKRHKFSLRPKKPPKFVCSDDEDGLSTLPLKRKASRESSVRTKDDGDDDLYDARMSDFNDAEIQRNRSIDLGELKDPEDKTFDSGLSVPGRIWSNLFDYQKIGVSWLWELHCQQAGGIIGDEMGLGKTIQMIAFMAGLRQSRLRDKNFRHRGIGPSLIVCPTTVMQQWVKEFHKWWPLFRVAILHSSGSATCSADDLVRKIIKSNGVLVTSYTTLVLHQDAVLPYDWHYVVLDEGHKIRNPDAQATLVCKQFRTPHRIILSGSPIQNNLKELWSLFDFVFPGKLGTLPDFMAHFSVPIVQGGYANATEIQVQTAYKCACVLRDTINPYLLRRMKADVKINLPSKNEQVLFCRLTDEQREVYMEYLQSRECQAILQGRFQIFAGLITLRKICNHADICTGGPKLYIGEDTGGDPELEYGYWKRSGKMIVVEALLKLWKKQGHRVLLFSQSRAMLDILEKFVLDQSYTYLRMDGGTPISTRQPLINTFNKDPSIYVFLLTTRVGGLGVNLTGANKVIIYDPDWNPSTDTQARERTWRIGQTKQVTIYRLLTSGTIEEKIYHRQIFKQFLTNRVLKDPKQRRFFKSNDLYELFDLGSKDGKEGTETSAIFAGTGSEVKKAEVKMRINRFDEMREKQKKEQKPPSDDEGEKYFEEEEIKRMRDLAKKLSEKIMQSKLGRSESKKSESASSSLSDTAKSKAKSKGERFLENNSVNIERNAKFDITKSVSLKDDSCDKCEEKRETHSGKKKKDSKDKPSHKTSEAENSKDKHKKNKKKQHKDAEFEGEKIPHLVKQDVYKTNKNDEEEEKKRLQEDDYVLHRLFKKTGMECAMKHDVIMDPNKHDYMIVEAEADRIAKEATKALKRSRSQCNDAKSGIPTWTGQSGVKKPRFGGKKNSLLVDKTKKADPILPQRSSESPISTMPSSSTSSQQHFDGSLAGNVVKDLQTGVSAENVMSSAQLILQMKKRNEVVTKPAERASNDNNEEGEEEGEEDTSVPVIDDESFKLISEIRNFILFGCSVIGKASTQEILGEFGPKLPPTDSPKFKAMLQKICDFERVNSTGFWKLKSEFRR